MIKLLVLAKNIDGGTGTFLKNLSLLNKKNNIKLKILVLNKPEFRQTHKYPNVTCFGSLNKTTYSFSITTLFELIKQFNWFKNELKKTESNIILTLDSHCLIIAQAARQLYFPKIKLISTIHNNLTEVIKLKIPFLLQYIIKNMIRFCLNKSNVIVCVSRALSQNIKASFKLKIEPKTIYYGIKQKPTKNIINNKKIIISIGRFFEQKDFFTIIESFSLIKRKAPRSELWLLGEGPEKNKLKIYIKKHAVPNVRFFGWVEDPIKKLQKAGIFVFSSRWEGFGYVLIEAMLQGLPVISTDTPFGPDEILYKGKYGILVPMKNPKAMSNAMFELLTDENKYDYYSSKSLERADFFTLDKMLNTYKKILFNLVN